MKRRGRFIYFFISHFFARLWQARARGGGIMGGRPIRMPLNRRGLLGWIVYSFLGVLLWSLVWIDIAAGGTLSSLLLGRHVVASIGVHPRLADPEAQDYVVVVTIGKGEASYLAEWLDHARM